MKKVKFDVKVFEEKRQVLVIGSVIENGIKVTQIGIAKCHENDEFDAKRGEKIAKHKALIKICKAIKRMYDKDLVWGKNFVARMEAGYKKFSDEMERHQRILNKFYK